MVTLLYVLHRNWIRKLKIHSYSNFSGLFHPNKRPSPCDSCHFIALFWMLFTKNERLNTWPSSYLNSTRIFLFVYLVKNHYTVNLVVILIVSKKITACGELQNVKSKAQSLALQADGFGLDSCIQQQSQKFLNKKKKS